MRRFFASPEQIWLDEHKILLTGQDVDHIRKVLRLSSGDELWVSDGNGREYHCSILRYPEKNSCLLKILYAQDPAYELPCDVTLFQALPKADKMEWIIQKAVELGVKTIVPVRTRRCVAKLDDDRAEKKTARWQIISESAAKQSRRLYIPRVEVACSFSDALERSRSLDHILFTYEHTSGVALTRKIISSVLPGQSVGIFIGPEGGFEEEEADQALKAGASQISLGKRILRTETAGIVLLSALMIHLEE